MPHTDYPLFSRYKRDYLVDILPFTADYLKKIQFGIRPASGSFRTEVIMALEAEAIDETALFGEDAT